MREELVLLFLGAGAAALIPVVWVIVIYNRFVALRQHIRESWAGIDVELKRRYDLIPNLVETVKGYARHEQGVLERVAELRGRAAGAHATASQHAADESALMREVGRLLVLVEKYPELKADGHFLELQKELATTEDRIAAARRFYNGNVRDFTRLRESFPTNLVASMLGVEAGPGFFELASDAERVVPRVEVTRTARGS
jgi:LemA protein